jgi:hypothetical protein
VVVVNVIGQIVGQQVDLPGVAVRIVRPHLVLPRVAAGRVSLIERGEARDLQPFLRRLQVASIGHLKPQMARRPDSCLNRVLVQRDLEGRLFQIEVGVSRPHLVRSCAEECFVELNNSDRPGSATLSDR